MAITEEQVEDLIGQKVKTTAGTGTVVGFGRRLVDVKLDDGVDGSFSINEISLLKSDESSASIAETQAVSPEEASTPTPVVAVAETIQSEVKE